MSKILKVPYIKQNPTGGLYDFAKKKWTKTYIPNSEIKGGKKIRTSGCGQCSTAMALYYCTGKFVEPNSLKTKYIVNGGSAHDIGAYEAGKRGIKTEYTTDINKVVEAIKDGNPVMSIQGKGLFTKRGHYILIIGVTDSGRLCINDPASRARTYRMSGKTYTKNQVDRTAKKGDGRAYTIFYVPEERKKINSKTATTLKNNRVGKFQTAYNKDYKPSVQLVGDNKCGAKTLEAMGKVKLAKGDKHKNMVKLVQTWLGIKADGKFGDKTLVAVKAYQKKKGLTADGVVGKATLKQMLKDGSKQ